MEEERFSGVTVFIPTYNRRRKLEQAVASALQETRAPIRVHVFDNASTDDTESHLRAAASNNARLLYTRRSENLGAYENFERAFAEVEGRYVIPLADDDLIADDFIFDAYNILEEHSEACAATFLAEIQNFDGQKGGMLPAPTETRREGLLSARDHMTAWMTHGHYHWSAVLWRVESLRRLPQPYLTVGMPSDVDLQAQLFARWPAYVVNRTGCVYRMHDAQLGWSYNLSHIPSWASLFRRLDAAIAETNLFPIAEYGPLREAMVGRYRGAWRKDTDLPLSKGDLMTCATAAGFALGDWPFAFDLLARAEECPGPASAVHGEVTLTPHLEGGQGSNLPVAFEPQEVTVLRWLKAVGESRAKTERLLRPPSVAERESDEQGSGATTGLDSSALASGHPPGERSDPGSGHGEYEAGLRELASMRRSLSWRITAPLRLGGRLIRRAFGR